MQPVLCSPILSFCCHFESYLHVDRGDKSRVASLDTPHQTIILIKSVRQARRSFSAVHAQYSTYLVSVVECVASCVVASAKGESSLDYNSWSVDKSSWGRRCSWICGASVSWADKSLRDRTTHELDVEWNVRLISGPPHRKKAEWTCLCVGPDTKHVVSWAIFCCWHHERRKCWIFLWTIPMMPFTSGSSFLLLFCLILRPLRGSCCRRLAKIKKK